MGSRVAPEEAGVIEITAHLCLIGWGVARHRTLVLRIRVTYWNYYAQEPKNLLNHGQSACNWLVGRHRWVVQGVGMGRSEPAAPTSAPSTGCPLLLTCGWTSCWHPLGTQIWPLGWGFIPVHGCYVGWRVQLNCGTFHNFPQTTSPFSGGKSLIFKKTQNSHSPNSLPLLQTEIPFFSKDPQLPFPKLPPPSPEWKSLSFKTQNSLSLRRWGREIPFP
jgi:hypothetical protein